MNTTTSNNNKNDNHATMDVNNEKMTASKTRSIKIDFEGDSHNVELPCEATLTGLQDAIASAFGIDLPADSGVLCFMYKDNEGDGIVLDKDSALQLALRLCPASLEISAARKDDKEKVPTRKADPEGRLMKIAARNLREYNGVPSMTPANLTKTLALLKLSPRRLVEQGLAPRVLLARMRAKKSKQQPLGGADNKEDLAESVAADMEVIALEEDDKKEWHDGFAAVHHATADGDDMPPSSDDEEDENVDNATTDDDSSTDDDSAGDAPAVVKKNLLHKAFVDGGVQLRPREVRPLLLALAVNPCRLAKLGLVNAKDLRAMLQAERKVGKKRIGGRGRGGAGIIGNLSHHRPHHPRHRHMARGGPGGPPHGPSCGPLPGPPGFMMRGGGGGWGRHGPSGPGAMGKMMRRHHAHPPPPPPPHMEEENDDGMFDAPAEAGGQGRGRRGGRRGDHGPLHMHPHPHHSYNQSPHHTDGMEEGEGGPWFYHGPPPGMRMRMRMHRARNGVGGGGGGQQAQHGYHYWG